MFSKEIFMSEVSKVFGKHFLVEFVGCNAEELKYVKSVEAAMLKAARISQATILRSDYNQFEPQGVSGFIFIMESHFSIHTWPEDAYAAFDILTCGEMYPEKAIESLAESLQAKETRIKTFQRGY